MSYHEQYKAAMLAGYEAMLQAANQENQSHPGIKALAKAMHRYWDIAIEQFAIASQAVPTANVEWATATKMRLLAHDMQSSYKIPE